jgi:hypothetical protein
MAELNCTKKMSRDQRMAHLLIMRHHSTIEEFQKERAAETSKQSEDYR